MKTGLKNNTFFPHTSRPAGIVKNIISNVTKNEEAGHGPVPCPSKAKWENERKEDEV